MKKLKLLIEKQYSLMTIEKETAKWVENDYILDGDTIRKSPACKSDPIFINLIDNDTVSTYVLSSASEIEPNTSVETANIWTKVKE